MSFQNIFAFILIVSIILVFKIIPFYFTEINKNIFTTYQFFIFSILIFLVFLKDG